MKPLEHLTILDLTVNTPGPFCSMILCDLGARVIKVEPPGGDPLRRTPGMFASLNRGKQSIILDLKTSSGRDVLVALAAQADVVLEGWRPGVSKRLGADYEALLAENPGLVYCSISGFGQDGPWRDRPGHDVNYLALSGYLGLQAAVEGRPWPPAILVSDVAAGLYAAVSVLAGLSARGVSRVGTYIDLSMAESALSFLGMELGETNSEGDGEPRPNVTHIPHYGLFPCSDGRWISLGIVHEAHFWDRLCRVSGLEHLATLTFSERVTKAEEIKDVLHKLFVTRPAAEWERLLQVADVPAAAVLDLAEAVRSPQFRARGAFVELGLDRFVGQPMKFSSGRIGPEAGPPEQGQHTDAILAELGHAKGDVAQIGESPPASTRRRRGLE